MLDWVTFNLPRNKFKEVKPHKIKLSDRENGENFQLNVKVGRSLDTDIEIRVECDCMFKNKTQFGLRLFKYSSKGQGYKVLAG